MNLQRILNSYRARRKNKIWPKVDPIRIYTWVLTFIIATLSFVASAPSDAIADAKAQENHRLDSLNILLYTILLSLTVLTIWSFKHRRIRFLHETGLSIFYGLAVGAIIRYAYRSEEISHIIVVPENASEINANFSNPPDSVWLRLPKANVSGGGPTPKAKPFSFLAFSYKGEIVDAESKHIEQKATFDPEIFFNILLPPIIFNAGYSLKRKYFFRNLGAIFTYAFIGTTISAVVIGGVLYGAVSIFKTKAEFTFLDTFYFGALISATDPVTVLAIFNDLHVDVNLYALVFGESVLNDAVAIVLSGAIENYEVHEAEGVGNFQLAAFGESLGVFLWTFTSSFVIGGLMGCATAILTKFTHIRDFPLLETALFFLMSYSTFLIAEAADLTGIVAVLFCGICQAHYTYNNLSRDSRLRTKQLFELLNFLAENFIFCYIGVSMFTFPRHHFEPAFIFAAFLAIIIGRGCNIYSLSFLLNLGRKNKISWNFQHVLFFSGLRGAIAFALAIRNTVSDARLTLLTTTSLIVIVTVIICGGSTSNLLSFFNIPVGVDDETECMQLHMRSVSLFGSTNNTTNQRGGGEGGIVHSQIMMTLASGGGYEETDSGIMVGDFITNQDATLPLMYTPIASNSEPKPEGLDPYVEGGVPKSPDKALLARWWQNFDQKYMKPFLTHSRPTLLETLPVFCTPIARILTTTEQLTHERIEPINTLSGEPTFTHAPESSLDGRRVM